MKLGPTYNMPLKRRKEGKTSYPKRLAMLKSGEKRLVVRKSNNSILGQIIEFGEHGDVTVVSANARQLKGLSWNLHFGNTPAAYLTGYLLGKMAKQKKVGKAIFDIGLQSPVHGSRIFALLKGAIDAGLQINHSPEALPSAERASGKHIGEKAVAEFENVKKQIDQRFGEKNA